MKILHVIYGLGDQLGGPPAAVAALARAQAEQGDDVIVLPATVTAGTRTLAAGREPGLLSEEPASTRALYWRDGRVLSAVRRLAAGRDILHAHMTWRYHVLAVARVARETGVPFVVSPRGNLVGTSLAIKAMRKRIYFSLFERRALDRAAAIHLSTRAELDATTGVGLRPRLFVVPNPVESRLAATPPDDDGLRRLLPDGFASRPFLLFVGRIWPIKRLDVLLLAFERMGIADPGLSRWGLVIAGPPSDPALAARLEDLSRRPALAGRVAFTGMVRDGVRAALYRRCSLYAQISGQENFGMSVAEALSFGRACILTPEVGLAPPVEAAGAGRVCPGTVEGVADALVRAAADPDWRERAGRAAALLARAFEPRTVAAAMGAEYSRCLNP